MKNSKGFTLVELLAVIAILGFLAILVLPNVLASLKEAKKNAFVTEAKTVFTESTNTYTEYRTEGNRVSLISNVESGGTVLSLSSEKNLKYTIKLDKNGDITSYKIYNDDFCVVGLADMVDNISTDSVIELLEDGGVDKCNAVSMNIFNKDKKLALNL